jgi:hypothetical protein
VNDRDLNQVPYTEDLTVPIWKRKVLENQMDKVERKIFDILTSTFKSCKIEDELAATWAYDTLMCFHASSGMQEVERKKKSREADLARVVKAANNLRLASKHLENVGLWGGQVLSKHALKAWPESTEMLNADLFSSILAPKCISEQIAAIRSVIDEATSELEGQNSEPDAPKKRGRKPEDAARIIALRCGRLFWVVTGEKPRVPKLGSEDGTPRYGPFLNLVTEIFLALSITASPQTWADNAAAALKTVAQPASIQP